MSFNILRYKGKSSETRFEELEEERKKKDIDDKKANLEGRVAQINPSETAQPSVTGGGLAVAAKETLYILDVIAKKARIWSQRDSSILALASHNGKLYEAGYDGIVTDTLTGKAVAQRISWIRALASNDGTLYDAGKDERVFDTFNNEVIARRFNDILALVSHNGRLYDSRDVLGVFSGLFDTSTNKKIVKRPHSINALASHDGKLYDAINNHVQETLNNKLIAERENFILALASHDGRLYDAGQYNKVFDTLNDPEGKSPLYTFEAYIYAMCSLPQPLFKQMWDGGKDI